MRGVVGGPVNDFETNLGMFDADAEQLGQVPRADPYGEPAAIETLTGVPFGSASTLSACAAITDVIKNLSVKTCGYSGLMLPIMEDPVLARRAAEGRYTLAELLLYSSVCGTGLDVVPIPGDTPVATVTALLSDVAALANKYQKPLSARLFPAPGKQVGDTVSFDNPHLTDAMVMAPG